MTSVKAKKSKSEKQKNPKGSKASKKTEKQKKEKEEKEKIEENREMDEKKKMEDMKEKEEKKEEKKKKEQKAKKEKKPKKGKKSKKGKQSKKERKMEKKERKAKNREEKKPKLLPCKTLEAELATCASTKGYSPEYCYGDLDLSSTTFILPSDEDYEECQTIDLTFQLQCECRYSYEPPPFFRDRRLLPVTEVPNGIPINTVAIPDVDCYTGTGQEYRGEVNMTVTGMTCRPWAEMFEVFISGERLNVDEGFNHCTNVHGKNGQERPWCFVSRDEWDYCTVPPCSDLGWDSVIDLANGEINSIMREEDKEEDEEGDVADEENIDGILHLPFLYLPPNFADFGPLISLPHHDFTPPAFDSVFEVEPISRFVDTIVPPGIPEKIENLHCYNIRGDMYWGTVNQTDGGLRCQYWNEQLPNSHKYGHMGDHNFCRNPNNKKQPWCYIDDPRAEGRGSKDYDYCPVPKCERRDRTVDLVSNEGLTYRGGSVRLFDSGSTCNTTLHKHVTLYNCKLGIGTSYAGTVNITVTGTPCLNWGEMVDRTLEFRELYGRDVRNYCRNPDRSPKPWCFVTETKREYCNVPACTPEIQREQVVIRANVCSRWIHDEPDTDIPWCYEKEGGEKKLCVFKEYANNLSLW